MVYPNVSVAQSLNSLTTVNRITNPYTGGEGSISNVTGFIAVVTDITKVKVNLTNPSSNIECDGLLDATNRATCNKAKDTSLPDDCIDYYGIGKSLSQYVPANRSRFQLIPNQNAIQVAADVKTSGKDVIAFNLGFFSVKPHENRDTNENNFKPIYQEACSVVLGTYSHDGNFFSGRWENTETLSGGGADKNFATIVIRPGYKIGQSIGESNADSGIQSGDIAFSGVYLREDGADVTASSGRWPQFVFDKRNSVVGRTAIGIGVDGKTLKIVVVQNGNGGTNTSGANIATMRNMFKSSDFPDVLLLDGSGSSQFATSLPLDVVSPVVAGRTRTNCVTTEVTACTWYGDTAKLPFIEQYLSQWRPANSETAATDDRWVDRRVSPMMVISGPSN